MRIIIWPENLSDTCKKNQKGESIQRKLIKLKHPVTETECLCVYEEDEKKVYEITQFSEPHRSWFIANKAYSDGSVLITTPLDPLFLLLPYLEKNGKRFSILEDILQDEEFPDNKYLISTLDKSNIEAVADFKDFSDKKVYKFDENKTVNWLKAKATHLAKVLELKSIEVNTAGSYASNYVETKEISKESYLEYACDLLSEYISAPLCNQLKNSYGFSITELSNIESSNKRGAVESDNAINSSPKSKKAKIASEPDDDYSSGANGNTTNSKSNQKLSVTQKRLLKVDKTGMKNLSHFFTKK